MLDGRAQGVAGRGAHVKAPPPVLPAQAATRLQLWRLAGESIVFTNGVYDLLHRGHVEYLEDARSLGDRLVVGINSDASVRRLKGPTRPILPERDHDAVRIMTIHAAKGLEFPFVFLLNAGSRFNTATLRAPLHADEHGGIGLRHFDYPARRLIQNSGYFLP